MCIYMCACDCDEKITKYNNTSGLSLYSHHSMYYPNVWNSGLVVCLQSTGTTNDDASKTNKDKKKKAAKMIELPLEVSTHGLSPDDLQNCIDQEVWLFIFF